MAARNGSRGRGSNRVDELTSTTQRQASKEQEINPLLSKLLVSGLLLKELITFGVSLPTSVNGVQRAGTEVYPEGCLLVDSRSNPVDSDIRHHREGRGGERGRREGQPLQT